MSTTYDVTCRHEQRSENWYVDEVPSQGDRVRHGPFKNKKKALSCVDFLLACDSLVATLQEQGA